MIIKNELLFFINYDLKETHNWFQMSSRWTKSNQEKKHVNADWLANSKVQFKHRLTNKAPRFYGFFFTRLKMSYKIPFYIF